MAQPVHSTDRAGQVAGLPSAASTREASIAPGPGAGARLHVGHRQDLADRAAARHHAGLAVRLHHRVCAHVDVPLRRHRAGDEGHRHLGREHSCRLGLRHRQLRLVDRHRPRGHADFGHPAAVPAAMAHVDRAVRRGDDALRGCLRGHVPGAAHRAPVDRLLALPVPELDGPVAAVPQPADLGRVRGVDLRDGLGPVLVRGADSRPGDDARQGEVNVREAHLRDRRAWLARVGDALAAVRDRVAAAGRARHAARRLRSHGRQLRLRGVGHPGLARDDLPALLRRRRHLLRLCHGADARHSHPRVLRARGVHHAPPHPEHGEDHVGHGADRALRLHGRSVHVLVQREPRRRIHDREPHDAARTGGPTPR